MTMVWAITFLFISYIELKKNDSYMIFIGAVESHPTPLISFNSKDLEWNIAMFLSDVCKDQNFRVACGLPAEMPLTNKIKSVEWKVSSENRSEQRFPNCLSEVTVQYDLFTLPPKLTRELQRFYFLFTLFNLDFTLIPIEIYLKGF